MSRTRRAHVAPSQLKDRTKVQPYRRPSAAELHRIQRLDDVLDDLPRAEHAATLQRFQEGRRV